MPPNWVGPLSESEFEQLMGKLLKERPELNRSEIEQGIKDKKQKIGAGYLTDQGALFLIASDLNISLADPLKSEVGLKDILPGAKEVTVTAKVMSMSAAKQFPRKDGTMFFLRTLVVYDSDTARTVKMWDEKANLPGVGDLKPGDLVRLVRAYVKADLDGSPTIHVGSGSEVEMPDEKSDIPPVESMTVDVGTLSEEKINIAVSGLVDGSISTMQYTSQRGRAGKALRMQLKGEDGRAVRVVVWGKDEKDLPAVIVNGSKARLYGVKSKQANQGIEVHGTEATTIVVEGAKEATAVKLRILSSARSDPGPSMVFGVDADRNTLRVLDTGGITNGYGPGDTIECMPIKAHGNVITLDGENSYAIKTEGEFPSLDDVITKVGSIKAGDEGRCIKVIVLNISDKRDIQTKSGEQVALGEMLVEDQTGQITVKGWRNQARLVDSCALGEIIQITDLNARAGLEGRTDLVLGAYSVITKADS